MDVVSKEQAGERLCEDGHMIEQPHLEEEEKHAIVCRKRIFFADNGNIDERDRPFLRLALALPSPSRSSCKWKVNLYKWLCT
jgi:hypothetical protein